MTRAFESLFGIPDAFAAISLAGRTDTSILADALERAWHAVHAQATSRPFAHDTSSACARKSRRQRRGSRCSRASSRCSSALDTSPQLVPGTPDRQLRRGGGSEARSFRSVAVLPLRRLWRRRARSQPSRPDRARPRAGVRPAARPSTPIVSSSSAIRRATSRARTRTAPESSPSRRVSIPPASCARPAPRSCSRISRIRRRSSPPSWTPAAGPAMCRELAEAPGSRTQPPRLAGSNRF